MLTENGRAVGQSVRLACRRMSVRIPAEWDVNPKQTNRNPVQENGLFRTFRLRAVLWDKKSFLKIWKTNKLSNGLVELYII